MQFQTFIILILWFQVESGLGDLADNQLSKWAQEHPRPTTARTQSGIVITLTSSQTVGHHGPVLLQDSNLLDLLAHFNRERIPERVVHAKGGGAFGTFEVTHDIKKWSKSRLFSSIGKKTPVLMRFSETAAQSGEADTLRDARGFSVKFYTEDGNWDVVGLNLPVFQIRDPILFPALIRSRKRNPVTHLTDTNAYWDFNSLRPETTFHTMIVFSDLGIPDGFRFQNGFGIHAFKFVNETQNAVYVKIHFRSNQGIKTLDPMTATKYAGEDPDYAIRDLYNAIAAKNFPSWDMGIQIMTFKEAKHYKWNPFDTTKFVPFENFPIVPIGKITLNRNPIDYFTQIEQAAFSPSLTIPGVEASPDRMLHGRLFAYPDSQRYRVGPNFLQLPINRPTISELKTYQKDAFMCLDNNGAGAPNYYPNSFNGPSENYTNAPETVYKVAERDVVRDDLGEEDNYSQADWYWRNKLDQPARKRLVENLATNLKKVSKELQDRVLSKMFDPVNSEISSMLRSALSKEI